VEKSKTQGFGSEVRVCWKNPKHKDLELQRGSRVGKLKKQSVIELSIKKNFNLKVK
jgi:hypothetical protein